ncbi:hypothetical protein OIU84_003317 [Salix udensis]|uniref:Uncharacterized protein n=1 Tax=Salix udensis TaxID=889485 RepID=A0AAD6P670_9ROSI|nr:hypothetical protein OIU84_003317 [Salix udensis]
METILTRGTISSNLVSRATSTKEQEAVDEDSTMKSKLFEILKKATDNCDAEKLSNNWHEMVASKLEDEFKKHRALGDEELIRKARGGMRGRIQEEAENHGGRTGSQA